MSEWKEYNLGQIGSFNNGVNKGKNSFGHGYPFVNLMDIFDKDTISNIPKGLVDVSQDELNRYNLKDGDILFVRSSVKLEGVGKVCAITNDLENTIYSGFIIRYRQSELIIDKLFASYYLNSAPIRTKVIAKATLSANSNINQESLKTISIKIPLLPEQRRIAQILSTADSVIEQTQAAIAKYKAIKQGLLHDLFTRGIDISTGRLRPKYEEAPELYKESKLGWIPKEWRVNQLEEITDYVDYRGKTPPKSEFGIYLVTARNIKNGIIDYEISKEYIREDAYESAMSRGKVKLGDVLITTEAPMGNVAQIDREDIALAQRVIKYRGFESKLNNDFLSKFLMSENFQKQLTAEATGSTVLGIKGSRLHKLRIVVPEVDEQTLIAERIKTADNKIENEQIYLQKLQKIKTGLMADLLSGKKRVKILKNQKNGLTNQI